MKSGIVGGTSWLGSAFGTPGLRVGGETSRAPLLGFVLSYALTASSLALTGYFLGRRGFDLLIVAMGWPHILLGLVFNLNKLGGSDRRYQLIFGGLVTLTVAIGFVHSIWPITTLIYLYFIFHAFRDEIFIYRQRATGHRFRGRVFDHWGLTLLAVTVGVAIIGQVASYYPAFLLKVYLGFCGLAAILTVLAFLKKPHRIFEQVPGASYAFLSLLLVIGAMTGLRVLRMQGMVAPFFFSFLVVFHYFSWYVFFLEKVRARPPVSLAGMKTGFDGFLQRLSTRRGFVAAIVALNVLSFAGAFAYVMRPSPALALTFDLKYFLYFLVFHVTVSFAPKGPARIPALQPVAA